ncbi:MAG: hypothetical protein Ct9H300mP32_2380 [Verrucomicrobiota bacterium]|nr:MAG: hypothetical protein Ct9H300mP32_2380 [Verrucomicrobiota bacterium]
MPEWNEQEYVSRARSGDMEACDALWVCQYQERIYATIYHMTSKPRGCRRSGQETFIKAFRKIENFKGDSAFFTWLYRIAVNNTINFLRSKRRRVILSINQMDEEWDSGEELLGLVSKEPPTGDRAATSFKGET